VDEGGWAVPRTASGVVEFGGGRGMVRFLRRMRRGCKAGVGKKGDKRESPQCGQC